jgi:hypothetical protein
MPNAIQPVTTIKVLVGNNISNPFSISDVESIYLEHPANLPNTKFVTVEYKINRPNNEWTVAFFSNSIESSGDDFNKFRGLWHTDVSWRLVLEQEITPIPTTGSLLEPYLALEDLEFLLLGV